jgi:hypothetical protein
MDTNTSIKDKKFNKDIANTFWGLDSKSIPILIKRLKKIARIRNTIK